MKKIILILSGVLIFVHSAFAGYTGVNRGVIHRAFVKYSDLDTITVTTGYGDSNGHYFEITSDITPDMTSLALGEDFHYIYIDDSASTYPGVTVIDALAEPAWSDEKQGWYNGNDRCIGVVYSDSGSATLVPFLGNKEKYLWADALVQIASNMNPNSQWQTPDDFESSEKLPVNAVGALFRIDGFDPDSTSSVLFTAKEQADIGSSNTALSSQFTLTAGVEARFTPWVLLGDSRKVRISGSANDENTLSVWIKGYEISR